MRHPQSSRSRGRQGVVRYLSALEDAETLVTEWTAADTIEVENRRMRGQAGPDRRMSVALRPLQQSCQASPVWLFHEAQGPRLCPGHDESVEMIVPEAADVGIEAAHMAPADI